MVKRAILFVTAALGAYLAWSLLNVFLSPDRNIQQIYLIPKDAVFIIQTDEPVENWKKFSTSPPWQKLKQAPAFAEISANADMLDSILQANRTLLSLVGQREMMVSVHKTRTDGWDFLIVLDMQKMSKANVLKERVEQIYRMAGQQVTGRKYNGVTISELRDPKTRDILYTAFVDNHFVASYTANLVEASIDEREQPSIGRDYAFIEAEKPVAGKGLCRVYVNYSRLPSFMTIYLGGGNNEYLEQFSNSMSFAGLYGVVEKDIMEVEGYSLMRDEADPYVEALLNSGTHMMKAHEIMSARTALYVDFGFERMQTFVDRLEAALAGKDKVLYDTYRRNRERIEKYFDISLNDHFLGWMSGEIAFSQSEPGLLGREPEQILAIRATDIDLARSNMDLIEKRIKRRTPVSVKAVEYNGYEINHVEMKGFFRLFFGKLFDKFETPYYTFVEDYVVFGTTSASLLSFVEDYRQGNLLKNDEGFKRAYGRADNASTIFAYIDMPKFYGQLLGLLNAETRREVSSNRDVLYSFPQWMFQLADQGRRSALHFAMDYKPYIEPAASGIDVADEDDATDEDTQTERELISELKSFHAEKFEGNVLREFYSSGALQSEAEVKDGRRHGRYREYYENGALKLRGRFSAGRPRGTWKYYTEDGKFDRKDKR